MQEREQLDEVQVKVVDDVQLIVSGNDTPNPADSSEAFPDLGRQYEVLELVGSGGMSLVYKVREASSGRLLVAKVLRGALLSDGVARRRFQQECMLVQHLTHPNIIEVIGSAVTDAGLPFLLMEWLDGVTLADYIKMHGPVSLKEASPLFEQMTLALTYAHGKGIIHRDIKPSNVLLVRSENGFTVKIMDFGIAKILESEGVDATFTQTGNILGSPAYMSPEQCLGESIDSRSDIYSLGCVMYETLTAENPFIATTSVATILRHIESEPESILSEGFTRFKIPDYIEQVIVRCLAKKPELRFQSAGDVRANLSRPPGMARRLLSNALDLGLFSLSSFIFCGLLPAPLKDLFYLDYGAHVQIVCAIYVLYRVVPELFFRATPGMLLTGLRLVSSVGLVGRAFSSVARALIVCAVAVWVYVLPGGIAGSEALDHATGSNIEALINAGRWSLVILSSYLIYLLVFVIAKREPWALDSLFGCRIVRRQAVATQSLRAPDKKAIAVQSVLLAVALAVVCLLPQYPLQVLTQAWTNPAVTRDLAVWSSKVVHPGESYSREHLYLAPVLRTGHPFSDRYFTSIDQVVGKVSPRSAMDGVPIDNVDSLSGEHVRGTAELVDSGIEAEREGDAVLAEEYYRKGLKLSPTDREGLCGLVRILTRQGRNAEVEILKKRIGNLKAPDYCELAKLLNQSRQYEEAMVVARKAVDDNPKDASALKQLLVAIKSLAELKSLGAMKSLGAESLTEPVYRELLALERNNIESLTFLAERALERKQYTECKNLARRAVAVDAKCERGWTLLADALEALGDHDSAGQARAKALLVAGETLDNSADTATKAKKEP